MDYSFKKTGRDTGSSNRISTWTWFSNYWINNTSLFWPPVL